MFGQNSGGAVEVIKVTLRKNRYTTDRLIGHYIPQEKVAWPMRINSPSLSCRTYVQPSTAYIFGIIIPA